jgi:hypothetical protein
MRTHHGPSEPTPRSQNLVLLGQTHDWARTRAHARGWGRSGVAGRATMSCSGHAPPPPSASPKNTNWPALLRARCRRRRTTERICGDWFRPTQCLSSRGARPTPHAACNGTTALALRASLPPRGVPRGRKGHPSLSTPATKSPAPDQHPSTATSTQMTPQGGRFYKRRLPCPPAIEFSSAEGRLHGVARMQHAPACVH